MSYIVSTGRRYHLAIFGFFIITILTFYYLEDLKDFYQNSEIKLVTVHDKVVSHGFVVKTPGCRIPDLNPFDESILQYLKTPPVIQCSDKLPLIESNQTSIWIVESELEKYNVNLTDLDCCYSAFKRAEVEPHKITDTVDDLTRMESECHSFKESANIFTEFVEVTCRYNNITIYRDYHAFVVPKKTQSPTENAAGPGELSVLILGADSLSRLNYYRQMPRTKELVNSLKPYEFLGYNKVNDNTFPNLVPLLSGYSVSDIQTFCWFKDTDFFDDCPWIWKNFKAHNYYTVYAEDSTDIGTFNYLKNGFVYEPTDYYLRPYMAYNEKVIGHTKPLNTHYCAGARFVPLVLFDYAYKFSLNMTESKKKFWGFFWEASLTHDFLNVPRSNDDIFFDLFKNIVKSNILNSTMVIFMSDHGMRWGDIRETFQGRMEESLPFLYILLPNWFKEKYKSAAKNLELNTHLLTTHFDLYETMKDLLDMNSLRDEVIESRIAQTRSDRGVSLFLPIPINRTCESADIGPSWCTCQKLEKLNAFDKNVWKAARFSVNQINRMLQDYPQCAKLKLTNVLSATVGDKSYREANDVIQGLKDYVVVFVTEPGNAKFEATVRLKVLTDKMSAVGSVLRINAYGQQSRCVNNYRLKLYCYCG